MNVDASAVRAWLPDTQQYVDWVADLEQVDAPAPVDLPTGSTLRDLLDRMAVPSEDAEEIAATQPDPERDPELWWLLERCRHRLVEQMGVPIAPPHLPHLPEALDAKGRYFYVHMYLAVLPDTLAYFEQRRIPDDIVWETLADLGRQIPIHRRIYGRGGLDVQFWFTLHFRGLIYSMGRLQFNRARIDADQDGAPYGKGDYVLGVHIPEAGPMSREECDESFRRVKEFYATYFPEEPYRYANCTSWLLDDQLADYLPAESNIVHFQRRFELMPWEGEGDKTVFQFVFRKVNPSLDELPRRTTLERAIVTHLENGGHWKTRRGWLEL